MSEATAAVLAAAVAVLLVLAIARVAPPRHRITVVRRGRVARTSAGRLAAVVPLLESIHMWPVDPCRMALTVRAVTASGSEVRVHVDLAVLLAAQPRGRTYDDARSRLAVAVEQQIVAAAAGRDAADLADPEHGVVASLIGHVVPGGAITEVELAGVELMLLPPVYAREEETDGNL